MFNTSALGHILWLPYGYHTRYQTGGPPSMQADTLHLKKKNMSTQQNIAIKHEKLSFSIHYELPYFSARDWLSCIVTRGSICLDTVNCPLSREFL